MKLLRNIFLYILIIIFILLFVSIAHGKNILKIPDEELNKLKNSIVVEMHPFGPLVLVREIIFNDNCILIDPLESDPDYMLFHYDNFPKIFLIDKIGKINEFTFNQHERKINVGKLSLLIPTNFQIGN